MVHNLESTHWKLAPSRQVNKHGQGKNPALDKKTSQELRMLSSVTLNCEVTNIVRIQVLNDQNQCLKCRKSSGLSLQLSKW